MEHIKHVHMNDMFSHSGFAGDVSQWDVSKAVTMDGMFAGSEFHGNLRAWQLDSVRDVSRMFDALVYTENLDTWRPKKLLKSDAVLSFDSLNIMMAHCVFHWQAAMENHYALPMQWAACFANLLPLARGLTRSNADAAILIQRTWLQTNGAGGLNEPPEALALPPLDA